MKLLYNFWQSVDRRIFEDASTGASKFSVLDGLRGIAVLAVFLSHSSGFDQRLAPWLDFRLMGLLGVYLFFVLSGFMLGYGLLGRSNVPVGRFFVRRFLRIAPLYYLVVTVVFVLQLTLHRTEIFSLRVNGGWVGYLQHLLFFQGDSVFWTIAAEFEFYFLLPFVCIFLQRLRWAAFWILAGLCLFYGCWSLAIEFGYLPTKWALRVAKIAHNSQYLDVFMAGVLASFLGRDLRLAGWRESAFLRHLGSAAAVLIAVCSLALVARNFAGFDQIWQKFRHFSLIYGVVFSLIILAVLPGRGGLAALLNHKFLRVIGITCFSWYLLHFLVIGAVNLVFGHVWNPRVLPSWEIGESLRFGVSFIITFVVAIVSYLLVEKPFMMLSRNLLTKRPAAVSV